MHHGESSVIFGFAGTRAGEDYMTAGLRIIYRYHGQLYTVLAWSAAVACVSSNCRTGNLAASGRAEDVVRHATGHPARGPVLDLGVGAGRVALYLQERGLRVTAVDASPGAAEVCRRRGVADVRLGDVNDPPADQPWAAVLLLCGNLGLGGSWEGSRRLLARLAELAAPGAVLVGDSVTPAGSPQVDLRIRYQDLVTPWWPQYNIPAPQMAALVEGTGWRMQRHLEDGDDHAVLLRRT